MHRQTSEIRNGGNRKTRVLNLTAADGHKEQRSDLVLFYYANIVIISNVACFCSLLDMI